MPPLMTSLLATPQKQEGLVEEPTQPTELRVEGSSRVETEVDVIASAEVEAGIDDVMIDIE